MYVSLDAIRLDTTAHIIAAWMLVHHPQVKRMVTPGEIVMTKDRIQFAAVECGLGFLPVPDEELWH